MQSLRIGFVVEQKPEHAAYDRLLHASVSSDPGIEAYWRQIPLGLRGRALRLPFYSSARSAQAGWRARQGLQALDRQASLHAVFFHTQLMASMAGDWLLRLPSLVALEVPANWRGRLAPERLCRARLVASSRWAQQALAKAYGLSADSIEVIPPGVDLADWAPVQLPRGSRAGVVAGSVRILCVGSVVDRSGRSVLLEAFRSLRGWEWESSNLADWESGRRSVWQNRRVELHLVTRDPVRPEPGVHIHTALLDDPAGLKQLYAESDIFCLPMAGAAQPVDLWRAGAAGLPIVAVRTGEMDEIVRDGQSGLLVEPGDVVALTRALRHVVVDPALQLRLGQQSQCVVAAEYDAAKNMPRLLELLKLTARTAISRSPADHIRAQAQ